MTTMKSIRRNLQRKRSRPAIQEILQQREREEEEQEIYRRQHELKPGENIEIHKMLTMMSKKGHEDE
jgi:hypothetical protein